MTRFRFREFGRAFVPISIKPQNDIVMIPIDFKVDTGSDVTTISKESLADLGYDMDWINQSAVIFRGGNKPINASGDKVNAGYICLSLINILGYEAKNWPFQIVIDEKQDFRNLLGRDLLTGFDYCFDNSKDLFTIDRAKAFRPRYPFLPNQEINEMISI